MPTLSITVLLGVLAGCAARSTSSSGTPVCEGETEQTVVPMPGIPEARRWADSFQAAHPELPRPARYDRSPRISTPGNDAARIIGHHYPPMLLRERIGGTTVVGVMLTPSGRPAAVRISRGSGRRELDEPRSQSRGS